MHLRWLKHLVGRRQVWLVVAKDQRVTVDRGTKAKARVWVVVGAVVVRAVAVDTVVPGDTGFGLGLHHNHLPWIGAGRGLASAQSWATGRDLGSHYKQIHHGCSCYTLAASHRTSSYAFYRSCSQSWSCC